MSSKRLNIIANIVGLILIIVAILWLLSYIKRIVFIISASIILAYLIKPPVDFLCKYGLHIKFWKKDTPGKGLSRTLSIMIIYLILLLVLIFFLSFVVPKINNEAVKFITSFPDILSSFQKNLEKLNEWLKPKVPEEVHNYIYQSILKGLEELGNSLVNLIKQSFSIIGAIFSTLATILIVPLLAFLFLKDIDSYRTWFLSIFPMHWRKELITILNKIDEGLGGFIRGQILVCICIGISTIIGLYILGIDYAFLLGTIVGMLNIIPFAGPILGSIPAVVLAFATKSPGTAFGVIIMFLIIHEVEKNYISPPLVGRSVGLPTLVILISILAGAELFGIVGVLVAVPFVVASKVILSHIHQKWEQTWPENNPPENSEEDKEDSKEKDANKVENKEEDKEKETVEDNKVENKEIVKDKKEEIVNREA
jgi:predicted PurR-regulated permease PerM